ncbi:hypothetical protein V5799_000672 [Amblyomma americanum]|uniref:Uncharacterized protein n=1 Tax=Amblyomma americanum TaxID=6943 RepID=A0AAQ4D2D4_AMBAM
MQSTILSITCRLYLVFMCWVMPWSSGFRAAVVFGGRNASSMHSSPVTLSCQLLSFGNGNRTGGRMVCSSTLKTMLASLLTTRER